MNRRLILFLLTIIATVAATNLVCQAQQTLLTHHVREVTRTGEAQSIFRLSATQSLNLDVVLALRHQPELQNFLEELYDPSSPSYRHFLTVQDFTARFGPSQEDYNSVIRFAKASGFMITGGSLDSMEVQLRGSVGAVEKAFHVTMGVYQHPTENRMFYAPDREPSVDLPFQLWHISGLDNYSIPRPASLHKNAKIKSNAVQGSCPGGYYCGSDMRAAYYGGTLTGTGQSVGLLEYLGYDIADLHTYFTNTKQTLNVPITGVSTDGSSLNCAEPGCDDTEQILDMTQAVSMAPGLKGLYVFVGQTDTALLASMSTHTPLVGQIGSSWTWQPSDPSTDDPYFQRFAAQGQSYFQAAGDNGAFTTSLHLCLSGRRCVCHSSRWDRLTDCFRRWRLEFGNRMVRWWRRCLYSGRDSDSCVAATGRRDHLSPIRVQHLCGILRTFRPKPILIFTSVPINSRARADGAVPVLQRRCGPVTWR